MNVEEFVRDALIQVSRGTIAAAEALQTEGLKVLINPTGWEHVNRIEFDVAVTAENSGTGSGDAKLSVLGFGSASGKFDVSRTESVVSRIKFELPLSLPSPNQVNAPAPK